MFRGTITMVLWWVVHLNIGTSTRFDGFSWSNETEQTAYMRECVKLAKASVASGNSPYGAVIVDPRDHRIIVTGQNHAAANPIWHGEMDAINRLAGVLEARNKTVYEEAKFLELYTSAEPCSMCMSALAWSGIGRVYYGTSIPYIAAEGLDQISIRATTVAEATEFHPSIRVIGGILRNETDLLYKQLKEDGYDLGHHHHHHA